MDASVKSPLKKTLSIMHGPKKEGTGISQQGMRLADFIRDNTEHIVSEWTMFAKTLTPAASDMTPLALRDHIREILAFIISDIESPETSQEQVQKSHGKKEKSSSLSAAETHAALRLAGGFDIDQMVSEYRALRASVIKLWNVANPHMNASDIVDLTRFNESIDQELAESVRLYTEKVGYSKDLFVGILSHELRTPLNVISMSAQLILNAQTPGERKTILATQISDSSARIIVMINDLLDVTRARFGSGLPVMRAPMDLAFVSQHMVDEMRAAHPTRSIVLDLSGDLKGNWDQARLGQVFSNLIGNAIQYGFTDSPIKVAVKGLEEEVVLSVHNEGIPIPPEKFKLLFESLTRAVIPEGDHPLNVNLGLGLYITEEIIMSHGGTIDVVSSKEEGTIFTARLPRSF